MKISLFGFLAPLLIALFVGGCGNTNLTPALTSSAAPEPTVRLQLDNVPDDVDEIGITGLDRDGRLLWKSSVPKSPDIEFGGVPQNATELIVEYLENRRVTGISLVQLNNPNVRAQLTNAPDFLSLSEAIVELSLSNTDVEMPQDTILLLKLNALLPNGKSLEFGRSAAWVSSNPGVATVEDGLVKGISMGETTIIAKLGVATVETQLTVSDPPQNPADLVVNDGDDHTLDFDNGTLDGNPLPGWNAKNKTLIVGRCDIVDRPKQLRVVGDDWVMTTTDRLEISDVDFTPDEAGPTIDCYFFSQTDVQLSSQINLLGYFEIQNGEIPNFGWPGGHLTVLCDGDFSSNSIDCNGSAETLGPGGRGGVVKIKARGALDVFGPILASPSVSSFGCVPGDIILRSEDMVSIDVNSPESGNSGEGGGGLTTAGSPPQVKGPGGPGGRITIAGRAGVRIQPNCDFDASGADGPSANASGIGAGGRGGKISVISSQGTISCSSELNASGGSSFTTEPGGDGGIIRLFAPTESIVSSSLAQGGDSKAGVGGAGGRFVLTGTPDGFDVSGGAGNPSGPDGTAKTFSQSLTVEPGDHQFDTDAGTFDGLDLPGWDPTANNLVVTTFEIVNGGTQTVIGSHPFSCQSSDSTLISGTLSFPGDSLASPQQATPGGDIFLFSDSSLSVESTGLIESPGGASDGPGANGGLIQLVADTLDLSGRVTAFGGESSNGGSGSGGDVFISTQSSATISGTIDTSGSVGFNSSGQGGSIILNTDGSFESTGSLLSMGGESGLASGSGGNVALRVGTTTTLNEVNCNGGDSGVRVGPGGTFSLNGQGDITLNGQISANAGASNTNMSETGGTITINGGQSVTINAGGSVAANGSDLLFGFGPGGAVVISALIGVVQNGPVTANAGGSVTITP